VIITICNSEEKKGETILTVRIEQNDTEPSRTDTRRFTLSVEQVNEILHTSDLSGKRISILQFDALEEAEKQWEVNKKALDLLAYSDNTQKRLRLKLLGRGYSVERVDEAIDYLSAHGLINDAKLLEGAVLSLLDKKYGETRIRQELLHLGFDRDTVDDGLDKILADVDFSEQLYEVICEKADLKRLGGYTYYRSFCMSLARLGYSFGDIRRQINRFKRENDLET